MHIDWGIFERSEFTGKIAEGTLDTKNVEEGVSHYFVSQILVCSFIVCLQTCEGGLFAPIYHEVPLCAMLVFQE